MSIKINPYFHPRRIGKCRHMLEPAGDKAVNPGVGCPKIESQEPHIRLDRTGEIKTGEGHFDRLNAGSRNHPPHCPWPSHQPRRLGQPDWGEPDHSPPLTKIDAQVL